MEKPTCIICSRKRNVSKQDSLCNICRENHVALGQVTRIATRKEAQRIRRELGWRGGFITRVEGGTWELDR